MPIQEANPPRIPIPEAEIPERVLGVTLTPTQIKRAAQGEQILLENMHVQDRLVDGKISFKMENGKLKTETYFKKEKLEIPPSIRLRLPNGKEEEYKFEKQQLEDLHNEKTIRIELSDKTRFFVRVDRELNRITVKSENELKIPREIGGYTLTEKDQIALADNKEIPLRVYHSQQTNTYFTARVKMTDDKKGYEFIDFKQIPLDQVQEFKARLNHGRELETVIDVTTKFEQKDKTEVQKKVEKDDKMNLFVEFTRERNFEGLEELTKKGFKVSVELVDKTTKQFNYTQEEKTQLQSSVSIEKTKPVARHNSQEISI